LTPSVGLVELFRVDREAGFGRDPVLNVAAVEPVRGRRKVGGREFG
jgi:hypothetical protein